MTELEALAHATRLLSERAHMIAIIECCLLSITDKDRQAAAVQRHLTAESAAILEAKLDAQDTRLAEAIAGLASDPINPITPLAESQLTPA